MRTFLLAYMIAYTVIAVAATAVYVLLVPQDEKKDQSPLETNLDAVLLVLGLIGMILLLRDIDRPWLKAAWKVVSVALVASQFWLNLRARSRHLAARPEDERSVLVRAGDLGLLALLAPSLAFNLVYAFTG
jgi:nicotinamide riboside transporter PnuC